MDNTEKQRNYIFENLIKLAAPTSDEDIEKWFKVLTERGKARLTRFFEENDESYMILNSLTAPFSENEIDAAIRSLKSRKAIDNRRMPAEIVKMNKIFFTKFFKNIFDKIIIENEEMPNDWLNAILILLRKKKR